MTSTPPSPLDLSVVAIEPPAALVSLTVSEPSAFKVTLSPLPSEVVWPGCKATFAPPELTAYDPSARIETVVAPAAVVTEALAL